MAGWGERRFALIFLLFHESRLGNIGSVVVNGNDIHRTKTGGTQLSCSKNCRECSESKTAACPLNREQMTYKISNNIFSILIQPHQCTCIHSFQPEHNILVSNTSILLLWTQDFTHCSAAICSPVVGWQVAPTHHFANYLPRPPTQTYTPIPG